MLQETGIVSEFFVWMHSFFIPWEINAFYGKRRCNLALYYLEPKSFIWSLGREEEFHRLHPYLCRIFHIDKIVAGKVRNGYSFINAGFQQRYLPEGGFSDCEPESCAAPQQWCTANGAVALSLKLKWPLLWFRMVTDAARRAHSSF